MSDTNPIFPSDDSGALTEILRLVSAPPSDRADPKVPESLRRAVIAAGEQGKVQIGRTIINISSSSDIKIGGKILDAEASELLRHAISESTRSIEADKFERALRDYFAAMRTFSGSFGYDLRYVFADHHATRNLRQGDLSLDDVYVPLKYVSLNCDVSVDRPTSLSLELRDTLDLARKNGRSLKVLFEGPPGSGKSTILRQIVKYCWDDPTRLCLTERRIPLYVRLATMAESAGGSIEEKLWSSIAADRLIEMNSPPPPGWFTEWPKIMASSFVLLVDGFDEVVSDDQPELRAWLERVLRQNHDVVLTSRAISSVGPLLAEQFQCYRLIPFNDGQQNELAQKWLGGDAGAFLRELRRTQSSVVGRTPLLLTIAAFVYALEKRLPSGRTCLYDRFVTAWLGESRRRGIYHDLGAMADYLRDVICFLALQMTDAPQNTSEVGLTDRLAAFFQNALNRPALEASGLSRKFLRVSTRRTAVFSVSGGVCSWIHPTIREYLAAEAIVQATKHSRIELEAYIAKWDQESWQQVIIFLLAIVSRHQDVTLLVGAIIQDKSIESFLFVGAALMEGIRVETGFVEYALTSIAKLIVDEARVRQNEDKSHGAQTLRMASQTALRLLANFGSEPIGSGYSKRLGAYVSNLATEIKGAAPSAVDALVELGCFDELVALTTSSKTKIDLRLRTAIALLSAEKYECVVPELRSLLLENLGALSDKFLDLIAPHLSAKDIVSTLSGLPNPHSKAITRLLAELFQRWGPESVIGLMGNPAVDLLVAAEASELLDTESGDDQCSNFSKFVDTRLARQDIRSESYKLREWLRNGESWPQLARFALSLHIPTAEAVAAIVNLEAARYIKGLKLVFHSAPAGPVKFEAGLALRNVQPPESSHDALEQWHPTEINHDAEALRRWAHSFHISGQYEKSISAYTDFIRMTGGDNYAFDNRGACYLELGRYEEAIEDFTRALALEPEDAWALLRRGRCLYMASRTDQAILDFRLAETLNRMEDEFLLVCGECYREIGDQIQAVSYLNRYVEFDPTAWQGYAFRGLAFLDGAVPERALPDLTISVEIETTPNFAWHGLSNCYVYMRLMKERCALLETMRAAKPKAAEIEIPYIKTLLCLGNIDKSRDAAAKLIEENPTSAVCRYIAALCEFTSTKETAKFNLTVSAVISEAEATLRSSGSSNAHCAQKANLAIFYAAIGDWKSSQDLIDDLTSSNKFHNDTRFVVMTALIELSMLRPSDRELGRMIKAIDSKNPAMEPLLKFGQSFPNRKSSLPEATKVDEAVVKVERPDPNGSYPFPCYCRLSGIQGLDDIGHYCAAMLASFDNSIPTIALVTLETRDRVFGSCNFKAEFTDSRNFKFCDTYQTFLNRDINIFVAARGPHRILLTEPHLLERLENDRVDTTYRLSLRLVTVDSEILRKTNPRALWQDD